MRWAALAVAVLASSCAGPRFGAGVEVNHVQSPHFDVVGDLPLERLETEVIRLEQLFDVFTTFFSTQPLEHQRLPIVVMRSGGVEEFVAAGGFVATLRQEPLVVTSVSDDRRFFSINSHELVHLLSSYALPHRPRWFSEGIAELFEDAHFEPQGTIKMGGWRPVESWTSIGELLRWEQRPTGDELPRYQTARAVLFYLANRDEPRLRLLLDGLRARRPIAELNAEVFPPDEQEALLQRVKDFVAEGRFSAWRTSLQRTADVTRLPPLAPWEVEVTRASIYEALGKRRSALDALRAARAIAPSPMPPALAAEFVWRDWPAPVDAASPLIQLALADALDRSYGERLAAAEAATKALPMSAFAWYLLGGARAKVRDFEGALIAFDRAAQLAPQSENVLFRRANALLSLERCDEARAAVVQALGAREARDPSLVERWDRALRERCGR